MARPAKYTSDNQSSARSGQSLDDSSRMSATFVVTVDTSRADADFAELDAARARLRALFAQSGGRPVRGVTTSVQGNKAPGSDRDNGSMQVLARRTYDRVEGKVEEAMAEAMELGEMLTKIEVESAVTSWGEYRTAMGRGNGPGRDDTGTMVAGIGWGVQKVVSQASFGKSGRLLRGRPNRRLRMSGNTVVGGRKEATINGFFGWENPLLYQVAQEKGFVHATAGTGKIGKRKRPYVDRRTRGNVSVEGAHGLGRSMLVARERLISRLNAITTGR